jgi:LEA14-like dessication related protein
MKTVISLIIVSLAVLIAACGSGLVRGQPPLVSVATLQLNGQQIHTRVNFHNPNDVEMDVSTIQMTMKIGEEDLGRQEARPALKIHPNGTDEVSFDFPGSGPASESLAGLEKGDVRSIQYSVEGRVFDSTGGSEKFSQQGYFYPVPGRPGQFRGAAPQREPSG